VRKNYRASLGAGLSPGLPPYNTNGGDIMWFWIIVGLILLTIFANWAQDAKREYREKKRNRELEEINEKMDEEEDSDFLENYGDK